MTRACRGFLAFFVFNSLLPGSQALANTRQKTFETNSSYLIIETLTDDLIHFELAAGRPNSKGPIAVTTMVARQSFSGPTKYTETNDSVETVKLKVTVDRNTLCAATFDKVRQVALTRVCPDELQQPWKIISLDSPDFSSVHGLGSYFDEESTNGDWIGRVWDPLSDGFGARLRGFAGGANNFSMFPVMYALGKEKNNFGFFLDNTYKQMWDFRSHPWTVGMWGDQVRWYVFAGNDLQALRRTYMDLTGRPPVPPKRSFGLWISEFGYSNWDEVTGTLNGLRRAEIPVDGFGMDLQWFGGTFGDPQNSKMGSLSWDTNAFPNPEEMIQKLDRDHGVGLMLIEEPYISSLLPEHRELELRGFLVRDCQNCPPTFLNSNPWWGFGGMVDFTNPEANKFWHNFRRKPLVDMGVAAHWLDLGEPEQYNANAWYAGSPESTKHNHADVHNIYGMKWVEGIKVAYDSDKSEKRVQILSRTGTSGVQRHGAALWSGDTGTNWGNLRAQQRVQMQMSMSGIDYYGSDVGGFQKPRSDIEGTSESLYTQWFANAALFDVPLRPHAWNLDKRRSTSPALRGDTYSNMVNTRLRYQLSPYMYSVAHTAFETGDPVFPPAFFYFQDHDSLRERGDLKMIGPYLLAATVTQHGQILREVELPRGDWFNIQTSAWIEGKKGNVTAFPTRNDAALQLPLLARDGAIIPVMFVDGKTMNITGRRLNSPADQYLRLKVFTSKQNGSFVHTEDDGTTTKYQRGSTAKTLITAIHQSQDQFEIKIHPTAGTFNSAPKLRGINIELKIKGKAADSISFNGSEIELCRPGTRGKENCWSQSAEGLVTIDIKNSPVENLKQFNIKTIAASSRKKGFFICDNASTQVGTMVYIVGNTAALGNWNADRGVRMEASAYPTWTKLVPGLESDETIEWKCVKRREGGNIRAEWQQGPNNILTGSPSEYLGPTWGKF